MLFDILQSGFLWVKNNANYIVAMGASVLGAVISILLIIHFGDPTLYLTLGTIGGVTALIQALWLYFRRSELEKLASTGTEVTAKKDAEAGAGASAEASAVVTHMPQAVSRPWPRLKVVGVTAIAIIGLCTGAHYLGVHEANRVKNGLAVDISEAGLDISSIGAIPVRLQPIDSSHAIESLSDYSCLLEIGSGENDLIFYNAKNHETYSVPTSEVVVVSLSDSRQCMP